ncbi:hypothetical protein L2E82_46914 [Cichorium intybus]|uniref:Uncharacterized protein n=1 Tax=Cichorium intybus TaxID=13427 RepID=A0ACB8YV30_CICIN|nr:hypothetical protein L2E82_46914 [Cichorium intybus]
MEDGFIYLLENSKLSELLRDIVQILYLLRWPIILNIQAYSLLDLLLLQWAHLKTHIHQYQFNSGHQVHRGPHPHTCPWCLNNFYQ